MVYWWFYFPSLTVYMIEYEDGFSFLFQVSPQTWRRSRASLSDVSSITDIEILSVRQLKEILARNHVNYSGCCEKWELVERVSRLYREREETRRSCGCLLCPNYTHILNSEIQRCQYSSKISWHNLFITVVKAVVDFHFYRPWTVTQPSIGASVFASSLRAWSECCPSSWNCCYSFFTDWQATIIKIRAIVICSCIAKNKAHGNEF